MYQALGKPMRERAHGGAGGEVDEELCPAVETNRGEAEES